MLSGLSRDSVKRNSRASWKESAGFIGLYFNAYQGNDLLSKADPASIYHANPWRQP